jgi:hypothetical protein
MPNPNAQSASNSKFKILTEKPAILLMFPRLQIKRPLLGAFSAFFMECESFLEHQRQMHSRQGKNNAQTLFGGIKIPSMPQICNILDKISAQKIFVVSIAELLELQYFELKSQPFFRLP